MASHGAVDAVELVARRYHRRRVAAHKIFGVTALISLIIWLTAAIGDGQTVVSEVTWATKDMLGKVVQMTDYPLLSSITSSWDKSIPWNIWTDLSPQWIDLFQVWLSWTWIILLPWAVWMIWLWIRQGLAERGAKRS